MNSSRNHSGTLEAIKRCYDLEYLLLGDLRQFLDDPVTPDTRQGLVVTLDRLLDHLPLQLELVSEEGYMSEVLEEFPNWHRQIEALLGENMSCISRLRELRRRVANELPFSAVGREVSFKLRKWMESLETIREREVQILQNAFALDLGGEA